MILEWRMDFDESNNVEAASIIESDYYCCITHRLPIE